MGSNWPSVKYLVHEHGEPFARHAPSSYTLPRSAKKYAPVNPIWNVQSPVETQSCQIMRSDGFRLAGALKHKELRQDGDRLEPDGEGPSEFKGRIFIVEDERQQDDGWDEVCQAESVERGILCGSDRKHCASSVTGLAT